MGIIADARKQPDPSDIDTQANTFNIPSGGWSAEPSAMGALVSPDFWSSAADNAAKFVSPNDKPTTQGLPSTDEMSKMDWETLYKLRNQKGLSQEDQNYLAPYEHQAYAREMATGPGTALQQAILTLGYTPYKMIVAPGKSRSEPSLNEIGRGLLGAWQGLTK